RPPRGRLSRIRAKCAHVVGAGAETRSIAARRRRAPVRDDRRGRTAACQSAAETARKSGMTLRYEEIAEILKIIDSSNCDEVSIETGEIKLFVRRTGAGAVEATRPPSRPEPVRAAVATEIKTRSPSPAETIAVAAGQFEITAPMVGTFYRAPSPE